MMKNLLNGFSASLLVLSLAFLVGCQPKSGEQQTEGENMEAQAEAATEQAPQDERASRPSPPRQAKGTVGEAEITIDYSSPSVKGRKIWGGLVPYGQVWRTGANEATTFEVTKDITVEGKALPAGKYALFTIPGEQKWTIIFNTAPDQWGASDYDQAKDALRVEVAPQTLDESVEAMEISVGEGTVTLRWEKLAVSFKVA